MAKTRVSKLDRSIAGKVVLVTGAASGMGRATCYVFADEGAKVAATDVRAEGAAETVKTITDAGGEAAGWKLDVSDGDEIKRVVDAVADRFGGLDVVVNNAGIALVAPIDAEDYEVRWARSIDVLLTAHVAHHPRGAAVPAASRSRRGSSTSRRPRGWAPARATVRTTRRRRA